MNIKDFQKGTNFESMQSKEFEEHYTHNDFNMNLISQNSLAEEDNSFSSIIHQIFVITENESQSIERFEELYEKLKNENFSKKEDDIFKKGQKYKESLQLKMKEKIYKKRPFKEKKYLGRKRKCFEGLGEHNKYSDDNLIRKCKNVILGNIRIFINKKLKIFYPNENYIKQKEKELFKLKQNQSLKSKAEYNKIFLNKKLKLIFSEDISTKYSRYPSSHNKDLIDTLINEEDEVKRTFFTNVFNLTFFDCLNHFRGSLIKDELLGMNVLNNYLKEVNENNEDYYNLFKFFIFNFEKIVTEKKARKSIKNNSN